MTETDPEPQTPPPAADDLPDEGQRFVWTAEEFARMVIPNPDPARRTFAQLRADAEAAAAAAAKRP